MSRRRDFQAHRLYSAERDQVNLGVELRSLDLARRYVEEATASPFWRTLQEQGKVEPGNERVGQGLSSRTGTLPPWHVHVWSGGTHTALGGLFHDSRRRGWGISLPTTAASGGWALVEQVVIHELAHVAHGRWYSHLEAPGHGPVYAAVYLHLVAHWRGAEVAAELAGHFTRHGVQVHQSLLEPVPTPDGEHLIAPRLPVKLPERVSAEGTLHSHDTLAAVRQARSTLRAATTAGEQASLF